MDAGSVAMPGLFLLLLGGVCLLVSIGAAVGVVVMLVRGRGKQ
jgi:hypothetical protein